MASIENIALKTQNVFIKHVVKPGDCLWDIAKKYYKDGNLWETIYEANKEIIGKNAELLVINSTLNIPLRLKNLKGDHSKAQKKSVFQKLPRSNGHKKAVMIENIAMKFDFDWKSNPPTEVNIGPACRLRVNLIFSGSLTIGKQGATNGVSLNLRTLKAEYSNAINNFLNTYNLETTLNNDGISIGITSPNRQESKIEFDPQLKPSFKQCFSSKEVKSSFGPYNISGKLGMCLEVSAQCSELPKRGYPIPLPVSAHDSVMVDYRNQKPQSDTIPSFQFQPKKVEINTNSETLSAVSTGLTIVGLAGVAVLVGTPLVPAAIALTLIPALMKETNTNDLNAL